MSQDALNPDQFHFIHAADKEGQQRHLGLPFHTLDVNRGEQRVGTMAWHKGTGELKGIDVEPEYRRQGIATSLWNKGREIGQTTKGVVPPKHSPDRTDAGDAWARSTGGRIPKRSPKLSEEH